MKRIVTTLAIAAAMAIGVTSRAEAQVVSCTPANTAGPFCIDGTVTPTSNSNVPATNATPPCDATSPQACLLPDPNGNSKELAVDNGAFKINVINTAPLPMLDTETTNNSVDLNTVWIQTEESGGKTWFYFAWARDSATGSGFISIELGQNAAPVACNYAGVDFTSKTDQETAALIKSCNPWANRAEGDTLLVWDQEGGSTVIYKRVYDGTVWGDPDVLGTAKAQYSPDGFRGEAAVNLTDDVFTGGCENIANIIPNTNTGNSDQADYKDTVFFTTPPIQTCGTLVVTKVTDVAEAGDFAYLVDRNGVALRNEEDGGETSLSGTLYRHLTGTPPPPLVDLSDTHINLLAGTDYDITETVPTGWTLKEIKCAIDDGAPSTIANGGTFTVEAGKITTCTIYNDLDKASPTATTQPFATVLLHDSMKIVGIRRGATEGALSAIFRLYDSSQACNEDEDRDQTVGTGGLLANIPVSITLADGVTETTISTGGTGTLISNQNITYYWWAKFSGNNLNDEAVKDCGSESTAVAITHTPTPPAPPGGGF